MIGAQLCHPRWMLEEGNSTSGLSWEDTTEGSGAGGKTTPPIPSPFPLMSPVKPEKGQTLIPSLNSLGFAGCKSHEQ